MFPDACFIATVAHGDVAIIATQHHLSTLCDDIAVIDTGVHGSFGTAVAHGFDLFDGISQLHKPAGAGEQPGLKVSAQAEAKHRHTEVIHNGPKLVDLRLRQELASYNKLPPLLRKHKVDLVYVQLT